MEQAALRLLGIRLRKPGVSGIIQVLEAGFGFKAIDRLQQALGVPDDKICDALGITTRTLMRHRRSNNPFSLMISDRIYRVAYIVSLARSSFKDEVTARTWLLTPERLLGNRSPLSLLKTEVGVRWIEDRLERIREGASQHRSI